MNSYLKIHVCEFRVYTCVFIIHIHEFTYLWLCILDLFPTVHKMVWAASIQLVFHYSQIWHGSNNITIFSIQLLTPSPTTCVASNVSAGTPICLQQPCTNWWQQPSPSLPLPSLLHPTLTQHWIFFLQRFATFLQPPINVSPNPL